MKIEWSETSVDELTWDDIRPGDLFGIVFEEGQEIVPLIMSIYSNAVSVSSGVYYTKDDKHFSLVKLSATLTISRFKNA